MFERSNPVSELDAMSLLASPLKAFEVPTLAVLNSPVLDGFLELDGKDSFVALDDKVRKNSTKKSGSGAAPANPDEKISMLGVVFLAALVVVNGPAVLFGKSIDLIGSYKAHTNAERRSELMAFPTSDMLLNQDVPLAIEQSSSVPVVHAPSFLAVDEKLANSVEPRCPVRNDAEGQYRTKQEPKAPGVRNEHVPATKVKMCSELGGNAEKSAEMTDSHSGIILSGVTDCNQSDLKFYVDPRWYLEWGPPKSWPDQEAMIRILKLRLLLATTRRMFLGVVYGITA